MLSPILRGKRKKVNCIISQVRNFIKNTEEIGALRSVKGAARGNIQNTVFTFPRKEDNISIGFHRKEGTRVKRRVWLTTKRLEHGFTQTQLAEKVGISNRTLNSIEMGNRNPSGHVGYKLARALEFDMEMFYNDADEIDAEDEDRKIS